MVNTRKNVLNTKLIRSAVLNVAQVAIIRNGALTIILKDVKYVEDFLTTKKTVYIINRESHVQNVGVPDLIIRKVVLITSQINHVLNVAV